MCTEDRKCGKIWDAVELWHFYVCFAPFILFTNFARYLSLFYIHAYEAEYCAFALLNDNSDNDNVNDYMAC